MSLLRRKIERAVFPLGKQVPVPGLFRLDALLHGKREANEAWIRSQCNVAYLGDNTVMCRSLGRYKILVDTTDYGLAPHIMLDGYWEMWVTEVIARELRAGMVVADIGANIGYFTLLMAEMVGPSGRVHAFEPNPSVSSLLRRSLDVNGFLGRVQLHDTALGDTDGATLAFIVPENEPKNGHLQPLIDPATTEYATVQTARLDSRPDWREIEFAKIDVEGAEEMIWAGSRGLLESGKLRTVVLEFTPGRYADPAGFLKKIETDGFKLYRIDLERGVQVANADALLDGDPREDRMLLLRR
jgi:FkbM family methyltransferase